MRAKLEVPQNISLRTEFWKGYGTPEAVKSVLCTLVIAIPLTVICTLALGWSPVAVAVFSIVFLFALFSGVFSKIDNNQSIYDYLMRWVQYRRSQQVFFYKTEQEVIYIVKESTE